MEAGADGPDRDVEDLGDLLVAELPPSEEQEHVTIALFEAGQRRRERPAHRLGVQPIGGLRRVGPLRGRLSGSPSQRPVPPLFGAHVTVDEVGGDSDEPRAHVDPLGPVGGPAPEGDQEGLAEQVVGALADAPAQIPVDAHGVPVEERGEHLGLIEGACDQLGIRGQRARQRPRPGWIGWTGGHGEGPSSSREVMIRPRKVISSHP